MALQATEPEVLNVFADRRRFETHVPYAARTAWSLRFQVLTPFAYILGIRTGKRPRSRHMTAGIDAKGWGRASAGAGL